MNLSEQIYEILKKKNKTEEQTVETNNKKSDYENLISELKIIKGDSERINSIPEINVTLKEYEPKTDEQLKVMATNKTQDEYEAKSNALKSQNEQTLKTLTDTKKQVEDSAYAQKNNVAEYYDNATETLSNNAVKRGLQRSSIIAEQLKSLTDSEIESLLKIDADLNADLKTINEKITKANTDYKNAVADLDVKRAVEVSAVIEELKLQEQDKMREIEEFNVKALETMNKSNAVLNTEKKTELLKNRRNLINTVLNYYYALPKTERYEQFLKDSEVLELLGDDVNYVASFLV